MRSPPQSPCRYWLARVGGRLTAYPAEPTPAGVVPHDGVFHDGVFTPADPADPGGPGESTDPGESGSAGSADPPDPADPDVRKDEEKRSRATSHDGTKSS